MGDCMLRQAGLMAPTALSWGRGCFSTVLVLKLSLGCFFRMLLDASNRNPHDKKVPRWYIKAPLLCDPLSSAFLGVRVIFSLQLVPKWLLQFQASHADTPPLLAKNCSFQPGMIFKTLSNQYNRALTSKKNSS